MPEQIVITADRSWDGTADETGGPVEVLVEDGKIKEVGTRVTRRADAGLVALGDRTLLPGFIDCHVHSTINPFDMLRPAAGQSPAQVALYGVTTLRTILDHGFTTVRDLATVAADPVTVHLSEAVDAGDIVGPRMIVAPHLLAARGGHGDFSGLLDPGLGSELGLLADGPDQIAGAVRREARSGAKWIKFGASGGFATPSDDPTQTTYSQEEMDALVATARDLGLPCTPHAYGDESVRRAVRAGVRSIEHGNLASGRTLDLMRERGVFLVPTQFMVMDGVDHIDDDAYWTGKDPAERRKFTTYADRLRECARILAASDVKIAFGTDIGMFPHAQGWREFTALVGNGISPARALRAATSTAAELLDRPDLGRLAAGCAADLIAMPADPLDRIEAVAGVDFVMTGGRVHRTPDVAQAGT